MATSASLNLLKGKKTAAEAKTDAKAAPAKKAETTPEPAKTAAAKTETPKDEVKKGEKKPTKGKAVATAPLQGEIVHPDQLTDIVFQIENLKEKEAKTLVGQLADSADFTFFKLGGVLSKIQSDGWYAPHASLREYIENEHGLNYRRAMYWISIYDALVAAKVPWDKVKTLGWTKLKEISGILTPENVDEWVKKAEGQTVLQLIETVNSAKKSGDPAQITDGTSSTPVSTKTFKVHEDQKSTIDAAITKAKQESGTESDGAALEFICLDYVGQAEKKMPLPKPVLVQQVQALGLDAACELLGEAFPDETINITIGNDEAVVEEAKAA